MNENYNAAIQAWIDTAVWTKTAIQREAAAEAIRAHLAPFIQLHGGFHRLARCDEFLAYCNWQGSPTHLDDARKLAHSSGAFAVVARAKKTDWGATRIEQMHWMQLNWNDEGLFHLVRASGDVILVDRFNEFAARLRMRGNYGKDVVWGDLDTAHLLRVTERARAATCQESACRPTHAAEVEVPF